MWLTSFKAISNLIANLMRKLQRQLAVPEHKPVDAVERLLSCVGVDKDDKACGTAVFGDADLLELRGK